jgi:hypothetical protein
VVSPPSPSPPGSQSDRQGPSGAGTPGASRPT